MKTENENLYNSAEDIINEFEAGSPFSNLEKEEEYYRMFISRYGYDPRDLDDAA